MSTMTTTMPATIQISPRRPVHVTPAPHVVHAARRSPKRRLHLGRLSADCVLDIALERMMNQIVAERGE